MIEQHPFPREGVSKGKRAAWTYEGNDCFHDRCYGGLTPAQPQLGGMAAKWTPLFSAQEGYLRLKSVMGRMSILQHIFHHLC